MNATTAKRPNQFDNSIRHEVAREMLPHVIEWLGQGGDPDPDEQEVLEQLQEAFEGPVYLDGYKLAKELEDRHYWDPDEQLVDTLSAAWGRAHSVTRRHVKAWVAANGIQATHKVGDRVVFQASRQRVEKGLIVFIDGEHATYTIQEDGKSYKPPRPDSEFREGILIDFEKVSGLAPA